MRHEVHLRSRTLAVFLLLLLGVLAGFAVCASFLAAPAQHAASQGSRSFKPETSAEGRALAEGFATRRRLFESGEQAGAHASGEDRPEAHGAAGAGRTRWPEIQGPSDGPSALRTRQNHRRLQPVAPVREPKKLGLEHRFDLAAKKREPESNIPQPGEAGATVIDGPVHAHFCDACDRRFAEHLRKRGRGVPRAMDARSEGPKTVLVIRVDFSDTTGALMSESSASSMINSTVNNHYLEASFGKTSLSATVTPNVYRMPKTGAQYHSEGRYGGTLESDAWAAALADGYDHSAYDFVIVAIKNVLHYGWAGVASGSHAIMVKGEWSFRVVAHELGHTYGLGHANAWNSSDGTPAGAGSSVEYGDVFDTMGSSGNTSKHFNAGYKYRLDWLTDGEIRLLSATSPAEAGVPFDSTSGTYRIYAHDTGALGGLSFVRVIRKFKNAEIGSVECYDLAYRSRFPSNKRQYHGASFHWDSGWVQTAHPYSSNAVSSTYLIDMVQGTSTFNDGALTIGTTFSDVAAQCHITPVQLNATTPPSLDVVINLGEFPGNLPPTAALSANPSVVAPGENVTLSVAAGDPNADALAYAWSVEDFSNSPAIQWNWNSNGVYTVTVTVSDMKGGTTTASVEVTVSDSNVAPQLNSAPWAIPNPVVLQE